MSAFRPTVLTSSMRVIEANFRIVRERCGGGVKQIAVVKADAYGHGLLPVSRRLLAAGAAGLAVATVDEAVVLREAGVDAPILVLGGSCDDALREAVARGVSQAVYDRRALSVMQEEAARLNRPALAHLKIDTGMSRIGVRGVPALSALLEAWRDCPAVRIEGLFTHFAQADTDPAFTALQKSRFDEAAQAVRRAGYSPMRHAAASTGIALGPDYWYDAVRPGIVLYGAEVTALFPGIRPAQRLTTRPVRVEWIDEGDTVGYGRTFRAGRRTRVMTLPVGYGDGYPRILSGKADALVCGRRAPLIGRVCMDQLMVDVTDIPEASMDSEAVLLGEQGAERITPDELAALAGTIPYEIMLGFSGRVTKRETD
ncbi:MAG: alanine racemase [Clostridia bacterium]|nr:alanine racemase [Clostridia bacterium]MBO4886528.1 alanine racemase [Clostridia bacterium]